VGVRQLYEAALAERGYATDAAQQRGLAALERCEDEWIAYKSRRSNAVTKLLVRPPIPRGVYLWGGVGRGKSFLMDCFFQSVPLQRKTRLHFHEFMREVHRELQELKGTVNPLDELAQRIARRSRLICFDEFHVADIADAMILGRLLAALFEAGVVFVMTSNYPPEGLYPDGLQRQNFLPAIALLERHCELVCVDGGSDYRLRQLTRAPIWLQAGTATTGAALAEMFEDLADGPGTTGGAVTIEGRDIPVVRACDNVVWFDFRALCEGPRSQDDYVSIAREYQTVLLSDVPVFDGRGTSEDAARRFIALVDEFYDRRVNLVVSAAAAPTQLYRGSRLTFEFERTASRLIEMQSEEYRASEHRY